MRKGEPDWETCEFIDDALVDEDGDGDAEDTDDGGVATGPAEVEYQVLPPGVPLLDPLVLVHLHPAPHPHSSPPRLFLSLSLPFSLPSAELKLL